MWFWLREVGCFSLAIIKKKTDFKDADEERKQKEKFKKQH